MQVFYTDTYQYYIEIYQHYFDLCQLVYTCIQVKTIKLKKAA